MYSQPIIDYNIAAIEHSESIRRKAPFRIRRLPDGIFKEMIEHLTSLIDPITKQFSRDLKDEEQRFIENELILCKLDFKYWCERYCYIRLSSASDRPEGWDILARESGKNDNSGPIGLFILNGMQLALLQKLAELEEIAYSQQARGVPVNGILLIILKARQLGASLFWQAALRHRTTFYSYFQGLVAAVDDQSTQTLYRRSLLMYERMPFWMKADCTIVRTQVERGDIFSNGSVIELQDYRQEKDLGKGEMWNGFHGTEISSCAANRYDDHFEEGLFHSIPYDRSVLFGMESTAKDKTGPWYDLCTQVMSGTSEGGAGRFSYFFGPFYLIDATESARGQRSKYRLEVPEGWTPAPSTLLMAEQVRETSAQFTPGHVTVTLHPEVMYWYETTRAMFYRRGKLNLFLQAFPITPEEAFQHGASGAFTTETISRLSLNCARYQPLPYRLGSIDEDLAELESDAAHPLLRVGGYALIPMQAFELDKDPRGIIWIWELPDSRENYFLGADPAGGIPKWSRAFRQHNDINTDNGTIEIFCKGRSIRPCEVCRGIGWSAHPTQPTLQVECSECDGRGKLGGRGVQVAEFAAPIDSEELGLYIYVLGKLYHGASDMDECVAIVENNNTGILTIRTLQSKFNYSNLWQSESVSQAQPTVRLLNNVGWRSTGASVPILHARSRIVLVRRDIEIRSPWLVKELSDAIVKTVGIDADHSKSVITHERFMVLPGGGRHDDRMSASFMSWWPMFNWTEGDDYETASETAAREVPAIYNPASRDVTASEQHAIWNDAVEALFGDYDLYFGHYPDCSINCREEHPPDIDPNDPYADDPYAEDDGSLDDLINGGPGLLF